MSTLNLGKIKFTLEGTSHGEKMCGRVLGVPKGLPIDFDYIQKQLQRRKGGKIGSTTRVEEDKPVFTSGIENGIATGDEIAFYIENKNTAPSDYKAFDGLLRPSHADYPALVKYGSIESGGGRFSGRLTACLTVAGALFKKLLDSHGITVGAHVSSIGDVSDQSFDRILVDKATLDRLKDDDFPVLHGQIRQKYLETIEKCQLEGDSVGGTVECAITGLPAGLGEDWFSCTESKLATVLFAVPAVKGVEFGRGFDIAKTYGSLANDPYEVKNGKITASKNDNGGILGGLTTGMPLVFKIAVKPTPSIAKEQNTVDYRSISNAKLSIGGRHDVCIARRAAPIAEAAAELVAAELLLEDK